MCEAKGLWVEFLLHLALCMRDGKLSRRLNVERTYENLGNRVEKHLYIFFFFPQGWLCKKTLGGKLFHYCECVYEGSKVEESKKWKTSSFFLGLKGTVAHTELSLCAGLYLTPPNSTPYLIDVSTGGSFALSPTTLTLAPTGSTESRPPEDLIITVIVFTPSLWPWLSRTHLNHYLYPNTQ